MAVVGIRPPPTYKYMDPIKFDLLKFNNSTIWITLIGSRLQYFIWENCSRRCVKPNTHRRRRRNETVELRRVGVDGVYMNSQLAHDDCRRIRRCERSYLIQALVLLHDKSTSLSSKCSDQTDSMQFTWIFRPPVRSNGRTYKMLVMFFFLFFNA